MKRIVLIIGALIGVLLLGSTLALPAVAVAATPFQPDVTLVATFDGALRLSSSHVALASDGSLGVGDSTDAYLLLKNESGRTVQFSLRDVRNLHEEDPQSLAILGALDVQIVIGDELVYSGSYDKALGRSSSWFTVEPGAETPVKITTTMRTGGDNRYQGLAFGVDYLFEAHITDTSPQPQMPDPPTPEPPVEDLPKTGDLTIVGRVLALLSALLIGVAAGGYKRRRCTDDKRSEA